MVDTAAPEVHVHPSRLDAAVLRSIGTDAILAVPVIPGSGDEATVVGAEELAALYGLDLAALAARSQVGGSAGDLTRLTLPTGADASWHALPDRLFLVGVGNQGTTALRRAGAALARAAAKVEHVLAAFDEVFAGTHPAEPAGQDAARKPSADEGGSGQDTTGGSAAGKAGTATSDDLARAFIEGLLLASYRAPFTGSGDGPDAPLKRLTVATDLDAEVMTGARIGAEATLLARTLAATPSNIKNPAWLSEQATAAAKGIKGVKVTIRDETWLAENGLNGILAVGGGSESAPRLVTVSYSPSGGKRGGQPVVLVGKGITYDTGGLSLKPREAMVPMKTDMSGAAVVLAAVLGAARAKVPTAVVGVLPLVENAFGADSYRPGDVLRMVDGTTVEIANTDAEGRIVLADAMAWARTEYDPSVLVDVATLTGAATLGLGKIHGALYATSLALTEGLRRAGDAVGEPLWPMPLVEDYRHALDSDVADLCHISTDPHVSGGSITAALFLERFAGDVPWAHLDIAGPGRSLKTQHEIAEGPTGFSARALVHWLGQLDPRDR